MPRSETTYIHAKLDLAMLEGPQHARRQGRSNAIETSHPQGSCSPIAQSIDSLVFAKFELKLCVLDFFNEKSDILQSSCHALICCEEITFKTRHSIKFSSKSSFRLSVLNHTHTHIPYQLPIYPYALKRTLFACRCGLLFSGDVLLVECGISPKVHLVEDFVHK